MSTRNVNIACGSSFLLDESWINLDYTPSHPLSRKANLCAATQSVMIDYINIWTGENLLNDEVKHPSNSLYFKTIKLFSQPTKIPNWLHYYFSKMWIILVTSFLPQAFREQNVSYAEIGEKHAWMWDFHTMSRELANIGFHNIKRLDCYCSDILGFPVNSLDINPDGSPRKGNSSMYIEATK